MSDILKINLTRQRLPRSAKIAIWLVISLVIAVIVSEIFIRIIYHINGSLNPPDLFIRKPKEIPNCALKPNYKGHLKALEFETDIETNALGFRDRAVKSRKPGVTRIINIGDSFSFGWGVDNNEVFTEVCERQLNKDGNYRVEVINCGVPGYNSFDQLMFLKKRGLKLFPDIVIVSVYVGNDIRDNTSINPQNIQDPELRKAYLEHCMPANRYFDRLNDRLVRYSKLYAIMRFFVYWSLRELDWTHHRDEPLRNKHLGDKLLPSALKQTAVLLDEMKEILDAQQKQLVVVLIPTRCQIEYSDDVSPHLEELKEIDSFFMDWCERNSVGYIYLRPKFFENWQKNPDERLYYKYDNHWNVNGHRLAGQILEEHLEGMIGR